jgi:phage shock protein PspC (stress-responsive transcriptional regulator)
MSPIDLAPLEPRTMSTSDDLTRLADLHRTGALTDAEFERAKARVLEEGAASHSAVPLVDAVGRLRLSRADRWVGGVCGGLARLTGVQAWIWRLLAVLLALWGGSGLVAYALMWIFVPAEPAPGVHPARLPG